MFGKRFYEIISRHTLLGRMLSPWITINPIVLIKDGNPEIRLFMNNRYVGIRKGSDKPWNILAPYRLFINPDELPEFGVMIREALESEKIDE